MKLNSAWVLVISLFFNSFGAVSSYGSGAKKVQARERASSPEGQPVRSGSEEKPLSGVPEVSIGQPTRDEIEEGYREGQRKIEEIEAAFRAHQIEMARSMARAALLKLRDFLGINQNRFFVISLSTLSNALSDGHALGEVLNFYKKYPQQSGLPVLDVESAKLIKASLEAAQFGHYVEMMRLYKRAVALYVTIVLAQPNLEAKPGAEGAQLLAFDRTFLLKTLLQSRNMGISFIDRKSGFLVYSTFEDHFFSDPIDHELNRELELLLSSRKELQIKTESELKSILFANRAEILNREASELKQQARVAVGETVVVKANARRYVGVLQVIDPKTGNCRVATASGPDYEGPIAPVVKTITTYKGFRVGDAVVVTMNGVIQTGTLTWVDPDGECSVLTASGPDYNGPISKVSKR